MCDCCKKCSELKEKFDCELSDETKKVIKYVLIGLGCLTLFILGVKLIKKACSK